MTKSRLIASIIAFLIGFAMFSMVNAQTPEENKAAGIAFLAENAKKPGIVTTASGLQYQVITEGTGASPGPTDNVTVHYQGTTIAGKEFDSSYKRGAPATFPLNRVIPGWTEGLQLMKEGGKSRLFIPSNLAYGERGAGRDIGPNSALIFEVELIKAK
jgi:FKBP-type peptidyl-prolyl cis-trans isomerase FkpA